MREQKCSNCCEGYEGSPFYCPRCGKVDFPIRAMRSIVFIEQIGKQEYELLHIPEQYREESEFGVVLSSGPGYTDEDGDWVPNTVKVGDIVVYDKGILWDTRVKAADGYSYPVRFMPEVDVKGVVTEQ